MNPADEIAKIIAEHIKTPSKPATTEAHQAQWARWLIDNFEQQTPARSTPVTRAGAGATPPDSREVQTLRVNTRPRLTRRGFVVSGTAHRPRPAHHP
jgi:hypothetical protein